MIHKHFDLLIVVFVFVWCVGLTILVRDLAYTVYDIANHRTASPEQVALIRGNQTAIELLKDRLDILENK